VENLRGRVSSKIAYTRCCTVCCKGKFFGGDICGGEGLLFKMMVLAEQTVKRAGMIKDSQIFMLIFGSLDIGIPRIPATGPAGTNKVSHTVGGKRIIIVI
jgi:hypothetical protein